MNIQDGNRDSVPILKAENPQGKKNKKMEYLIIAVAVIAVIAVIIAVVAVKSKKKPEINGCVTEETAGDLVVPSDENFEPVTFTEDVEITFDGINSDLEDSLTEHSMFFSTQAAVKPEVSTTFKQTTAPATKAPAVTTKEHLEKTTVVTEEVTQQKSAVIDTIAAFFAGTYYFDGDMITAGEKSPMEIAMNGSDFQVFSELDGKDISIMQLDSKTYMLNPDTKKYAELTASFQKMLGIDTSDLKFEFNSTGFDAASPTKVTKATYNGQPADCYVYKNSRNHLEFIATDSEILQMTMFTADGEAKTILVADEFTKEIPSEMMNFKGYSKTNIVSFISSLM